MTQYNNFHISH